MLDTLKDTARRLLTRLAHRHQVGVYQTPEPDSLLLRSQKRVEAQRAIQREEARAQRQAQKDRMAARKAQEAPAPQPEEPEETLEAEEEAAAAQAPEAAPENKAARGLFVAEQVQQSEINLEVDSGLVSDWLEEGALLFVDVREVGEMLDGYLEGALLMPRDQVPARHLEIPRDQKVVIYSSSGNRSLQTANWLRARGHKDVWSMTGGFGSWLALGGQYVTPPDDAPLKLAEPVRLSTRGKKRTGRDGTVRGTIQEIRDTEQGLRYTLGAPLPQGGFELLEDLRRSDLAQA